jgi:hypothetical protein
VSGSGSLFGQRMTHARGCVSDTLPWGSNPTSPPAGRQDGGYGAVHVPSSVVAVRYADSERWRWLATHTLTWSRACASRGGSRGVHVVDLFRSLFLLGALSGTINNGICSPPVSAGPWSERSAGSSEPEQVRPSRAGGAGPVPAMGT